MPQIRREVPHGYGREDAVERLRAYVAWARTFSELEGVWDGPTYAFAASAQGMRFRGNLTVEEDRVRLEVAAPLPALAFAGWIPGMVERALRDGGRLRAQGDGVAPAEAAVGPVVLFLHIPKAGGSTLGEVIHQQCRAPGASEARGGLWDHGVYFCPFGFFKEPDLALPETARQMLRRPDLRAVLGHFWYGIHAELQGRDAAYVTMLRDPVDRVVSLYHYLKLQNQTEATLREFVASPPFKEVDNDQVRRIAGVDPAVGALTEADLERAKAHLAERFRAVGLVERFDESLALLGHALGWSREVAWTHRNANADRPPLSAIDPEVVAAIRARNALDAELHRFAGKWMDAASARAGLRA